MSEWSPQDWAVFFGVATPFIAGIAAGIVLIIKAVKENTQVTAANTADRAVKAAATTEQLSTIQTLVTDIHKGTGDGGVTVNVPPAGGN